MPVPLIPIALALASAIPEVAELVAGDKAGRVAEGVVDLAKSVAGQEDPKAAVAAINDSPALAEEMAKALFGYRTALAQEETKQLTEINTTMRQESESSDAWVRRWRPYLGYVVATSFGAYMLLLMGTVVWSVIARPYGAGEVINSLAGLTSSLLATWAMAMSVLGVYVVKRSEDKARAMGIDPPTMGAGIAKRLFHFQGSAGK